MDWELSKEELGALAPMIEHRKDKEVVLEDILFNTGISMAIYDAYVKADQDDSSFNGLETNANEHVDLCEDREPWDEIEGSRELWVLADEEMDRWVVVEDCDDACVLSFIDPVTGHPLIAEKWWDEI